MALSKQLKKMRQARNLTRKQLADLSGVSETAIKKYERGERQARTEQLIKLAKTLDCTWSFLLGETEDPEEFVVDLTKTVKGGTATIRNAIKNRIDGMNDEEILAVAKLMGISTEQRRE